MCCGGAHVGKAIQSVPDQTYANIELIMVDGASPDEHAAVVKLFSGSTKGVSRGEAVRRRADATRTSQDGLESCSRGEGRGTRGGAGRYWACS